MAKLIIKKHKDGKFHISSTNDDIKQVFFGWADGSQNPEFYGIGTGADYGRGGSHNEWRWELTAAKMRTLAMYIGVGFAKNYYDTRKEKADHRYVLERITKAVGA